MRSLFLVISLLAVLLLAACSSVPLVQPSDSSAMLTDESGLALKGARATIQNLYPGYTGTMQFEVTNRAGEGVTREVHISVEPEDDKDLGDGWVQLPPEYYGWFAIDKPVFTLKPGESQIVIVTVSMPEDADYAKKKARCELLVLGWTVLGTTTNADGEIVNVVGNVPIGVTSEWYIETY